MDEADDGELIYKNARARPRTGRGRHRRGRLAITRTLTSVTHRPPRRARRRRRPGRRGDGLLAGRGRPRRGRRREEDVPAREDLRRRPHAPGGPAARRHGPRPSGSTSYHRYDGLRAVAHGITLELQWPEHPVFPSLRLRGAPPRPRPVGRRARGEGRRHAARRAPRRSRPCSTTASSRGAVVEGQGRRATTGRCAARYVVVADGANSRFGRALGTARNRSLPAGHGDPRLLREPAARRPVDRVAPSTCATATATRCRATAGSSRSATAPSTSASACCRRSATGRRSTPRTSWTSSPPPRPAYWGIVAGDVDAARPPAGACRWAARSTRRSGPTWVVVGDAAGIDQPVQRRGHRLRLRDRPHGRRAARRGARRPATAWRSSATRRCSTTEYGLYFKVARLFAKVIGNPALMRELTRVGMQSRTLMEWVLRIMANLLRDDELGPAEAAYRAVAAIVQRLPGLERSAQPARRLGSAPSASISAARCSADRSVSSATSAGVARPPVDEDPHARPRTCRCTAYCAPVSPSDGLVVDPQEVEQEALRRRRRGRRSPWPCPGTIGGRRSSSRQQHDEQDHEHGEQLVDGGVVEHHALDERLVAERRLADRRRPRSGPSAGTSWRPTRAEVLAHRGAADATEREAERERRRRTPSSHPPLRSARPLPERRERDEHGGDEAAGELQPALPHGDEVERRRRSGPSWRGPTSGARR